MRRARAGRLSLGASERGTRRAESARTIGVDSGLAFALILALGLGLGVAAPGPARGIDILFPAYANPCCGGGPAMWSALIATASTPNRPFALRVVFNPASGPGTSPDPNYLTVNGQGPLPSLHAAGAVVYGYVTTSFGTRAPAAVLADIDAYLIGHYAGHVDGLFFDEVSSDLAKVGENRGYVAHIRSLRPNAPTIGNPGTPGVLNPSGQTAFTATDYANVFDVLVTFENTGAVYRTGYTPPVYLAARPARAFAHLIHSDGAFDPALVTLAASRKAGLLFVTDDVMPNPYHLLPTGWAAFQATLASFPTRAVPIASPLARILMTAALATAGGRWLRSRIGRRSERDSERNKEGGRSR